MPDEMNTSDKGQSNDRIEGLLEELEEALVEGGMDPATARERMRTLGPRKPTVVGNFADLQRMGAEAVMDSEPKTDEGAFRVHPITAQQIEDRGGVDESVLDDVYTAAEIPEGPENDEADSVDPGSQSPETADGGGSGTKSSTKKSGAQKQDGEAK